MIRVAKLPTGWLRKRVTTLYSLRWILFFLKNNMLFVDGDDGEKLEPFCFADENVKWCSPCGRQYGSS